MIGLTARQIQILKLIVEEFIDNARPVGSEMLDRKYNLGVSPATIRNEMVFLEKQGYLSKDHASAGRLPTSAALKLYVNELMKEKQLTVADEVGVKEKIWTNRDDLDELAYELARSLAEQTRALGFVVADGGKAYHAGYANLLSMPEFFDIGLMRQVLTLIEEVSVLQEIFRFGGSENPVQVVYGQELGNRDLEPISLIFANVTLGEHHYTVGVLGSNRFDYPYVMPMMRYVKKLLEETVT
jgi:heat-inducible transcriptional repressor